MKKRICSVMMVLGLIILPIINALCIPAKPVKAAGALALPQAIEMLQILYSVFASGMVVSGAVNLDFTDADTAGEVFTEFMDNLSETLGTSVDIPEWANSSFVLSADGTEYRLADYLEYLKTLEEPTDTQTDLAPGLWGKYGMTYQEWLEMQQQEFTGGTGETPPEEPTEPEPGNEPKISSFKMASGFFAQVAEFLHDLWNDEIPNYSARDYYNDNCFSGKYTSTDPRFYLSYKIGTTVMTANGSTYGYGLIPYSNDSLTYTVCLYNLYSRTINTNAQLYVDIYSYNEDGTVSQTSGNINSVSNADNKMFTTNLPKFQTLDGMYAFYNDDDISGITNKPQLNVADLIGNGISGSLEIFEGKQLKPQTFVDTYNAIKSNYETVVEPGLTDDPEVNTPIFQDTAKEVAESVLADAEVTPETDPGTDPGTGTETDNENINNYKTDLTMIFPFCLPFDFIYLLNVLDAEPIAPKFEIPFVVQALNINDKVILDMSFMENAMEIFRLGEIILFILLLIKASSKLIRW